MEQLDVYKNNLFVGKLLWERNNLFFRYEEEYLKNENAWAISISLPLSGDFDTRACETFFSGLLPEEQNRENLAKYLHISPDNTFAMLKEIGAECAGDISILPVGTKPSQYSGSSYITLTEEDAYNLLISLKKIPLGIDAYGHFRISGSGAQNKLIACVKDSKVMIPIKGTPSSHIIKPEIERFENSQFNEFFCMKLAKILGLNVAEVSLLTLKDKTFFVTERYDRIINPLGYITRLHQEDFCQALKFEPKIKYENEKGPSIIDCFTCIKENSGLAGRDIMRFINALLFNFIIGNGDAHGKNFSFLYVDGVPTFAPLYDLISTMAMFPVSRKERMSMRIDKEYYFSCIFMRKFEKLATELGMKQDIFSDVLNKTFANIQEQAQSLADSLNSEPKTSSPVYKKIVEVIRNNYRQLINTES